MNFARLVTAIPVTPGGVGIVELALIGGLTSAGGERAERVSERLYGGRVRHVDGAAGRVDVFQEQVRDRLLGRVALGRLDDLEGRRPGAGDLELVDAGLDDGRHGEHPLAVDGDRDGRSLAA